MISGSGDVIRLRVEQKGKAQIAEMARCSSVSRGPSEIPADFGIAGS